MLAAVLLAVASRLPVPYVRLAPGPVFNTLASYGGHDVIQISGATTYPTTGALDMLTVSELGGPRSDLSLGVAVWAAFTGDQAVVPQELLYPPDATGDQVDQANAQAFRSSQQDAVTAAARQLGVPLTPSAVVSSVVDGGPAAGKLRPGDVVVSIDGSPVHTGEDVGRLIRAKPVGTDLSFAVRRDDADTNVTVTSGPSPRDPAVPYVGISVATVENPPFSVTITLDDVGGPSAGLMFALGIVDKLTVDQLTGGRVVAGTGTIDADGAVGAVGGIRQKAAAAAGAGAQLFLMPQSLCSELAGHVPDGLQVTPVATLDGAVKAIDQWRAGAAIPACS
ncbi:MAG: PDZ domain-containing protein [Actinomycetota bacterium]|nr:MAG: PDZ domain-containing protein [Actinomycetota bacterium]